jgi:hypothetical protein
MPWRSNPAQAAHSHSAARRNSSAIAACRRNVDVTRTASSANAEVFAPAVLAVLAEGVGDLAALDVKGRIESGLDDPQVGRVVGVEAISSSLLSRRGPAHSRRQAPSTARLCAERGCRVIGTHVYK